MVVNKRSKNSRQRGSWTHGWGAKKKHRGAGHRGGRGNAGTGKRGDVKKPSIWKNTKYFGKNGFIFKGVKPIVNTINVECLNRQIETLINNKLAEFKDGLYIIDLSKMGYTKLLSKGTTNKKFKIICENASAGAKEKIEGAGGSVELSGAEVKKKVVEKEEQPVKE